jgi:hypothetical protein
MKIRKIAYKPSPLIMFIDLMIVTSVIIGALLFVPLTTAIPFEKYTPVSLIYLLIWFIVSYGFKRYKPLKRNKYFKSLARFALSVVVTSAAMLIIDKLFPDSNYSFPFFIFIALSSFLFHIIVYFIYFSFRYAVEYTDPGVLKNIESAPVVLANNGEIHRIPEQLKKKLLDVTERNVMEWIELQLLMNNDNTFVVSGNADASFEAAKHDFTNILILKPLNWVPSINSLFYAANQQLKQQSGALICCFEQKNTRKQRILTHYLPVWRWVVYFNDFVIRRFLPKLLLGRRLYYQIFRNEYRILHKTEVIGRLNYLGFSTIKTKKINGLVYIVAAKERHLKRKPQARIYGTLIKLRRIGKNGHPMIIYKFRTMYAYSEFAQEYIYRTHQLQEGGKFKKDIRVSSWGKFMRRYFIDELPMLWNILKGKMKLVGVRPISKHYLGLYTKELQQLRKRHKPGMLPPFYADLPKTLEEIQHSEYKYLKSCEEKGVLATDFQYFFKIIYNIVFKNATSA